MCVGRISEHLPVRIESTATKTSFMQTRNQFGTRYPPKIRRFSKECCTVQEWAQKHHRAQPARERNSPVQRSSCKYRNMAQVSPSALSAVSGVGGTLYARTRRAGSGWKAKMQPSRSDSMIHLHHAVCWKKVRGKVAVSLGEFPGRPRSESVVRARRAKGARDL